MALYWTGSCFPAPFRVTDYFGFGQESVEEGHAAGWKVFFLRLAPLFSDFGPGFEVVVEGRAVGRGCDEHWLLVLDWEGKRDICFLSFGLVANLV